MTDKSRGGMSRVIRAFTEAQIWVHKHLIHFTAIFLITGLPLINERAFWWVAYALGSPLNTLLSSTSAVSVGLEVARMLHRLAALGLAMVLIPYFFYELSHAGKLHIWPEEWSFSAFKRGVKELVDYYIHKRKAEFGKYNLGQKAWIWIVIFGTLWMYITGLIMWFRGYFSTGAYEMAHLLHDIGFYLAVCGLVVHVYLATMIPEHRVFAHAMFRTGTIDEEIVKEKHPRWYKKLNEEEISS